MLYQPEILCLKLPSLEWKFHLNLPVFTLLCCEHAHYFRESMVPSFIPLAQAKKILATGKSINFLREICQDHTPVKGREELKHALACANGKLDLLTFLYVLYVLT